MNIFFLGTGAAEGFPGIFSNSPLSIEARRRGGKDLRTRSSILINETIKIDLPPDTLAHVHKYPEVEFAKLEHLLFTHSHDDHFAIRELQYLSPNFAPDREKPLLIHATPEVIRKVQQETTHFFEKAPIEYCPLTPFEAFNLGDVTITPITANHRLDELCVNFLVTQAGKTLLYASDTGWYNLATWEFLSNQKIDIAIIECGKGISDNPYEGHLNLEEVIAFRKKLLKTHTLQKDSPVYITHLAHTGGLLHDGYVECCAPHNISVAYDGLAISL
jgi:phosphoribosyl 1,2-cyclic phosphate phosphodiesterase